MNTIDAFEKDIALQLDFLEHFQSQNALSPSLQKKTIFCGSGDSLSAAMMAESFSNYLVKSADPLDLIKNKKISENKHLYLISISGNTISNLKAAKIVSRSVAITATKNSKLDKICSNTILLDYPNSGIFTAGSVSFLASALTCISLVTPLRIPNFRLIYHNAKRDVEKFSISGNVFVLGNYLTYPVAMNCAAKFYEILGSVVQYERIEQFSHMGLFSSTHKDTVILFEEKTNHNSHLISNLKKIGINVIHPNCGSGKISQILYLIFFSQFLVLKQAKLKKLKDCHFVTAKKIRNASSNMIY